MSDRTDLDAPPSSAKAEKTTRVGPSRRPGTAITEAGLAEGTVIDGRYRIESELGRGGMGLVHLARDTWLDRQLAVKVIAPLWAANSTAASSFLREAKALAFVRSQYIVQVYAFGVHEGSYFLAMEYVRGKTLRQVLAEHRDAGDTMSTQQSLGVMTRIAEGVDAVHAAGIVHRDIKPANIIIEENTGRPVLVDFGLAVPRDDPTAALAIGTPHYMAPEQAGAGVPGATVGAGTDIYALGCTAFQMLTGRLPFESDDQAQLIRMHARKVPRPPSAVRKDLTPFDAVVLRALAKDPKDRYPTCGEMARDLTIAGERWNAKSMTVPPPQRAERNRPLNVLVVDDDRVFCKVAAQAVQLAFFRYRKDLRVVVKGANSGQEAIERAEKEPPDLILLDFDMPGLDGADTLSRLRGLPGGDEARVVVISGRVNSSDRWRFAVLGVHDFVKKPIDFRRLVDRLEGIARRVEQQDRDEPT
jgi:CheY-like chemotaxis protein/predicted Ser/Thr protein kinase